MCSIKVVQTSFCTKPKPSFNIVLFSNENSGTSSRGVMDTALAYLTWDRGIDSVCPQLFSSFPSVQRFVRYLEMLPTLTNCGIIFILLY